MTLQVCFHVCVPTARDVVAKLSEDNVCDLNDFQWISQLRYETNNNSSFLLRFKEWDSHHLETYSSL